MSEWLDSLRTTNGYGMYPSLSVWSRMARYTPDTASDGTVQLAVVAQLPQSTRPVPTSLTQFGCVLAGKIVVGDVGILRAPSPLYQPSR
jgi:hypothetical protein